MAKYIVSAKLDAPAFPLITVMYKIGIKIDNTENKIDREAMTKNSFVKLTQSFMPVFVPLIWLSHSRASSASVV